jgi:hypothetical protein
MKRHAWLRAWPLALVALIAFGYWANAERESRAGGNAVVSRHVVCANLAQACSVAIDGRDYRFGISGDPKPLANFEIWLAPPAASAENLRKVEAQLTMDDIDMGFNLFILKPDKEGVYRTNATLPFCVTGRRDWNLVLDIDNTRVTVPFVTKP